MAFSAGIANNSTDLLDALVLFCTTNGWTESAGVLSKGSNHFLPQLTGVHIRVYMGDAAGFAAPGITGLQYPYISLNGVWPVTYRIFILNEGGSDTVVLQVLEANATEYKYLMFGNLQNKMGSWGGGQWMHATYSSQSSGSTSRQSNAGVNIDISGGPEGGAYSGETYVQAHGPLFAFIEAWPNFGGNFTSGNSFVKCDLDGGTYKRNQVGFETSTPSLQGCVDAFRFAKLPLYRGRNAWNGESVLVPVHVYLGRASNVASRLGTVAGIRFMRMDNYEPGDIITLGLDRWMVLPMYRRDPADVYGKKGTFNTTAITGSSGQLAYAIKYDGP